jgi:hypothetical protein
MEIHVEGFWKRFKAHALAACIALGLIVAASPAGKAQTLTTLYSFCAQGLPCTDGYDPTAGLVQGSDGNFYGTTSGGGAYGWYEGEWLGGTVFKLVVATTGPAASFSSNPLAFGSVAENSSSTLSETISNTGTASLTITNFSITAGSPPFELANTGTCNLEGQSLNAGSSCTVAITFAPTATGPFSGTLSIADNASGSPQSVALTGTGSGVAPVVGSLPASLTFGNEVVGTTSAVQQATLSNTGSGALTISSIATSANFGETNNCNGSVAAGGSCTISVTFTPTSAGALSGTLTISDNASNSPQKVSLTGTGLNPVPTLNSPLSPSSATAGGAAFTLTVSGTNFITSSVVQWNGTGLTTTYASSTQLTATVPASDIAAAGTASVTVFNPSPGGGTSNALSFTITKSLPVVTFSASSVSFGNQLLGTTSPLQTDTLTNTGAVSLTIASVVLAGTNPGDFGKSADTCSGATVIPSGSCALGVTFTPTASGTRTASLTITDTASNSPQSVVLSGTGIAVSLSAKALSFGAQVVDSSSAPKTVTVKNLGSTPLSISGVTVVSISPLASTGTNTAEFTILPSSTCVAGGSVAGPGSCVINLAFRPSGAGVQSATLVIADSDPSSPQTVSLRGMGTAVSLSATSLGFGAQPVATRSVPKTIVLTNLGSTPLSIASLALGGTDAGDFAIEPSSSCGAGDRLASGGRCVIELAFQPTGGGLRSAALSISDSDPSSPQTVALSGTGVQGFSPLR